MSGEPSRQRDHLRPRGDRHPGRTSPSASPACGPRTGRRSARGRARSCGRASAARPAPPSCARLSGRASRDAGQGRDAGRGSWPDSVPNSWSAGGNHALTPLWPSPARSWTFSPSARGSGYGSRRRAHHRGRAATDHARLGHGRRCSAARRARLPRGPERRGRGDLARDRDPGGGAVASSAAMSPPARRQAEGTDVAEGAPPRVVALVVLAAALSSGLVCWFRRWPLSPQSRSPGSGSTAGDRPSASTRACGSSR